MKLKSGSFYSALRQASSLIILFTLVLGLSKAIALEESSVSADEFTKLDKNELTLLDVRTVGEYNDGFIPGAINMPVAELPEMFKALGDKDKQVVVYCRSGFRAARAISYLKDQGFTNLVHLEGDYGSWEAEKRPIEKP